MLRPVALILGLILYCRAEEAALPTIKWPSDSKLIYNYETQVRITDHLGIHSPSADVKLSMQISITQAAKLKDERVLLALAIDQPVVDREGQHVALEGHAPLKSAFLVFHHGVIEHLYVANKESVFWINVYKGVASFIKSHAKSGDFLEADASGECRSSYRPVDENTVERVKHRCSPMELSDELHSRGEGKRVHRVRTSRTVLRLKTGNKILESAKGDDVVTITVPVAGQVGPSAMALESSQQLKLQSVEPHSLTMEADEEEEKAVKRLGGNTSMRMTALATTADDSVKVTEKTLRKVIEQNRNAFNLEDGPKAESVAAFKTILSTIRGVKDSRVILKLIDDEDLTDMTSIILDATVICATGPCINVVLSRINLNKTENSHELERLLMALSHMTTPDESTLLHLLTEAQKQPIVGVNEDLDGLQAQLWATLGAMVGKYRLSHAGKYSKVTKDIIDFLEKRLNSAGKHEDVILALLTALQNVGETTEIAEMILHYLMDGKVSHRVHCAVMDTLMMVGVPDQIRGLARSRALRLVQSRPFQVDVTARVRALDLLLHLHPTMSQLAAASSAFKTCPQLREAFINRFRSWCRREKREDLWDFILQRQPDLIQYPGSSVQVPHAHVSTFLSGNSSKGEITGQSSVDLITGADGSVKRSDSSAKLSLADHSRLPLYRLVLYTDGISTANSESDSESADVTAGISLSILGVSTRPVRFFSGYGGLMTAIWNAPTSLTPFLQLNTAFIDAQHFISLQNGFAIKFVASGLASIDLSGMMSISLWTQKAESQMRTVAAIGLSVNAELMSSRISARLAKSGSANFAMNFDGNAEFSGLPPKMCFVASFPDTVMLWRVERSSGTKKEANNGRRLISGSTLSLGRSNERSCADILQ